MVTALATLVRRQWTDVSCVPDHMCANRHEGARVSGVAGCARCQHRPPCPSADRPDRDAARIVAFHPEPGWSLLCNGVVLFEDLGELLLDGRSLAYRTTAPVLGAFA